MIKTNGLGQALAFLLAKEEQPPDRVRTGIPRQAEGHLYKHLEEWLMDERCPVPWPQTVRGKPLLLAVIGVDSDVYRQASREALAYLSWLKRFAEASFGQERPAGG